MFPITKRLSNDTNYKRPTQTKQDMMGLEDIKDKLKDYKRVDNVLQVPINTHLRYFTTDNRNKNKKVFRLGGYLTKVDDQGRYVVLSNGQATWSVQIANSQFWRKMTNDELKNELKEEIIRESEQMGKPLIGGNISAIHDTNKYLEMENNELRRENKEILKKMAQLTEQMASIKKETKKYKNKKKI